ncbi:MAG: hypothetical protein K2X82_25455 [Gemmataceae bacterium]|nr:hypothetical protein [Gemmataceae bacterium]
MDLRERVERLERENQRLKRLGLAGLLAAAAVAATGYAAADKGTTEARQFVVVDEKGKPRATLGMRGDEVALILTDKDGKRLATLRTGDDARGHLLLTDAASTAAVEVGVFKRGPAMNFIGHDSKTRMILSGGGPAPNLGLYHDTGRPAFLLNGEGLKVYDTDGMNVIFGLH